jgi:hypothetical protein
MAAVWVVGGSGEGSTMVLEPRDSSRQAMTVREVK